jgi:uncharacterized protein (TIGR02611 family)
MRRRPPETARPIATATDTTTPPIVFVIVTSESTNYRTRDPLGSRQSPEKGAKRPSSRRGTLFATGTRQTRRTSMDHVRRVARTVSGFTLLLAGLLMIVLPGPGWVTIALGLALLAPHFPWAQRALDRIKDTGRKGAEISRSWLERLRRRSASRRV